MANPWFRVWTDMINDPKWRTIARISEQKIGDVIAVYMHMLTCASNATERGRTESWNDEDVATALDIKTDQVISIREAMQGRVLDGSYLLGWEKRQPIREDGSAERGKAYRERLKIEKQTQENGDERKQTPDKDKEEIQIKKEAKSKASATASRLPPDWSPDETQISFCQTERPDLHPQDVAARFRDYWIAAPGAKGRKQDWQATWRNWVRNEKSVAQPRGSPSGQQSRHSGFGGKDYGEGIGGDGRIN